MGLNRMMMGQSVDLKNIKATLVSEKHGRSTYGFSKSRAYGTLTPNPLPNGVTVTDCYAYYSQREGVDFYAELSPSSIKGVTIDGTYYAATALENQNTVYKLWSALSFSNYNDSKTIPVIFHFD